MCASGHNSKVTLPLIDISWDISFISVDHFTCSKVPQPSRPSNYRTQLAPESNSLSQDGAPVTGLCKEKYNVEV